MSEAIDKAGKVRDGEELDIEKLSSYFRDTLNRTDQLEVNQFPGGYSNLTYLIKCGEEEFVLRRPPYGANIKSAHDMSREYRVLSTLKPVFQHIPGPIAYEDSEAIIGAPFYIMERVKGIILRNQPPKGMRLDPSTMNGVSQSSISRLAELHEIDVESSGLIDLGKGDGYTTRQVEGWSKRYKNAETDDVKSMDATIEWLSSNIPEDSEVAFIHNDFKYDNLVLNPDDLSEIRAILDWEMATVGDPLMDLGTTLGYWCEATDSDAMKPFNLTWLPGNFTREEVAAAYFKARNQDPKNILFYYVFGCFKIGVIVQQIYARFKKGFTKDPRFAQLIYVVHASGTNAQSAIKFNRISHFK